MKIHLISTTYILSLTFTNDSPYQMIMLCSGDGDLGIEDRGLESFVSKKNCGSENAKTRYRLERRDDGYGL